MLPDLPIELKNLDSFMLYRPGSQPFEESEFEVFVVDAVSQPIKLVIQEC